MQECARPLNPPIRPILSQAPALQVTGVARGRCAIRMLRVLPPDKVDATVRYRTNRQLQFFHGTAPSLHSISNKCPFWRMG
jgi:hypothetical protein